MADDFQCDAHDEGDALRTSDGITHVTILSGERLVAFCGASVGVTRRAHDEDVDCMSCIVHRDRFAAGVSALGRR